MSSEAHLTPSLDPNYQLLRDSSAKSSELPSFSTLQAHISAYQSEHHQDSNKSLDQTQFPRLKYTESADMSLNRSFARILPAIEPLADHRMPRTELPPIAPVSGNNNPSLADKLQDSPPANWRTSDIAMTTPSAIGSPPTADDPVQSMWVPDKSTGTLQSSQSQSQTPPSYFLQYSPPTISPPARKPRRGRSSSLSSVRNSKGKSHQQDLMKFPVRYPAHDVPMTAELESDENQRQLVPDADAIRARKYATSMDERNFLTVYEFGLNDQSIIWDYYTGYVHLTGIWKALGNAKADIVRLLDGSPELEPVIRRVRGGFLKIQGTWVPYDIARTISTRICYPIRYALVPLFGPDFPEDCLLPSDAGFGLLQLNPRPRTRKPGSSPGTLSRTGSRTDVTYHGTRRGSKARLGDRIGFHQEVDRPSRRVSESDVHSRRPSTRNRALSLPHGSKARMEIGEYDDEFAVDESSSEEDDEPMPSPPPMPRKLTFTRTDATPSELVKMLQATRSLQQLSMNSRWSSGALGGGFEWDGRMFHWDGDGKLDEL